MMPRSQSNRFWEIGIGLFLLVAGLSALGMEAPPAVLLILLGIFMVIRPARQMREQQRHFGIEEDYVPAEQPTLHRQSGADHVYAHALQAVKRAGLDPDGIQVLPVDVGVMAFKSDQEPVVHRTRPVGNDIDYLQPFVQLRLPQKAVGRVKFELLDSDGQVLFVHEDNYQLERGRNLVMPAARLPIHDAQAIHMGWRLRVSADGVRLADHSFRWTESESRRLRRHIQEDGEISTELRAALAENRLQNMSLDELLEPQAKEDSPQRRQKA
ncbi:MAG: hypothetical protein H6672_01415 [Anaerolineaceae bacterium]|nr:hypothetical protein [Anaerolineaceae bacterium]